MHKIVRAQSPEPRAQSPEPRAQSPEPRAQSPEPRAQSPEPRAQSPEPRAQSPEPRAQSPEPRAQSPEPRAQSPESASDLSRPARSRRHGRILAARVLAGALLLGFNTHAQAQTNNPPAIISVAFSNSPTAGPGRLLQAGRRSRCHGDLGHAGDGGHHERDTDDPPAGGRPERRRHRRGVREWQRHDGAGVSLPGGERPRGRRRG